MRLILEISIDTIRQFYASFMVPAVFLSPLQDENINGTTKTRSTAKQAHKSKRSFFLLSVAFHVDRNWFSKVKRKPKHSVTTAVTANAQRICFPSRRQTHTHCICATVAPSTTEATALSQRLQRYTTAVFLAFGECVRAGDESDVALFLPTIHRDDSQGRPTPL